MNAVEITYWEGPNNPRGRAAKYFPDGFARVAHAAARAPHDRRGWSPATFKGGQRSKANVQKLFAVGLDFDKAGDPREVVKALTGAAGLVHTTRSHRPEAPRCRAIVWLDRPVTADEYAKLWALLAAGLSGELRAGLDVGAKDPSRLWFLPSRDATGAEGVVLELEGPPLPVDKILASLPPAEPAGVVELASASGTSQVDDLRAHLTRAAEKVARTKEGGRNNHLNAETHRLAKWLHLGAFTEKELRDTMTKAARTCGLDPTEIDTTLNSAISSGRADPQPAPLPVIRVGADIRRMGDEATRTLASDPKLFVRSGELVTVTQAAEIDGRRGVVQGAPTIRTVAFATLRERLTSVAAFEKRGPRGIWKACTPPDAVVSAVHARGEWPGLRPIVGTCEIPTLRLDGSILDRPGYDAATGLLYVPSCEVPPIPEHPTQEEARRALDELLEPLAEFPWAQPSDRSAVIAALLTVVARAAIEGPIPGLAIDANAPGSGKSILADFVAILATGRPAARAQYPEQAEELGKVLDAVALSGAAILTLDNVTRPLEGGSLDLKLTADHTEVRPLGRSETRKLPWRTLIIATGNGLDIRGDTRRRFLVPRLEPETESPENRSGFRIPNMRAWCDEHRGRLVGAALTVLRAYAAADHPDVGTKTWGSFESWSALIPPAIAHAGGNDPMLSRLPVENDSRRGAFETVLLAWRRLFPEGGTIKKFLAHVYQNGVPRPGEEETHAALEELVPIRPGTTGPDPRRLGDYLRTKRRAVVGGLRIDTLPGVTGGSARWRVEEAGGGSGG